MFKLIGAGIGFVKFGFLGGVIGYFIGSAIDRRIAYGAGGVNPLSQKERQKVFIETLFTLKGKLAKADGHISQAEIDQTEQTITAMKMSADYRAVAIDHFKSGSAEGFDHNAQLAQFMQVCGNTHNLKHMLMVYLIVLALADGVIDPAEKALLKDIAGQLGFNDHQFNQLMETVKNQAHFSSGGQGNQQSSASTLDDAYKALGVSKSNTDQEVKQAYKKLMSQYHPDKLIGQGLPKEMIDVATDKAQEIQAAYAVVKNSRPSM